MFRDRIFSILKNDSCPQHPSCFRKLPLTILCATVISRSEKLKEGGKDPSLQPLVELVGNLSQTPVKSLNEMSFKAMCFTEIKHQLANDWLSFKDFFHYVSDKERKVTECKVDIRKVSRCM